MGSVFESLSMSHGYESLRMWVSVCRTVALSLPIPFGSFKHSKMMLLPLKCATAAAANAPYPSTHSAVSHASFPWCGGNGGNGGGGGEGAGEGVGGDGGWAVPFPQAHPLRWVGSVGHTWVAVQPEGYP